MRIEKKTIKKICGAIFAVFAVIIILAGLTTIFERKASVKKYAPFFEQEEPFDILFLGTSHVINGIIPSELYHDYGYVSFNMGGAFKSNGYNILDVKKCA